MMSDELCNIYSFQERDIDLLLAEELRINHSFATWFLNKTASDVQIKVPAIRTRISVVEDGSESDVVACFRRTDGGIHRVYIEDKITAIMMDEQLERYLKRAKAELDRGDTQSFSVVLFAPENYNAKLPELVTRMTFEEAAAEFTRSTNDLRSAYKSSFLLAALPYKSGKLKEQNIVEFEPYVVEWWDTVYEMLDREFPSKFLQPSTRYPRSVYIAPRMSGMAKYLRVDFKGHLGEIDLAFMNINYSEFAKAVDGFDLPGRLIENGKSTSIRIEGLPSFKIADGLAIIDTDVRAAYAATEILLDFWKANRDHFDRLFT